IRWRLAQGGCPLVQWKAQHSVTQYYDIGLPASAKTLPPRPMKQTPAALSIQCLARWKRRITRPDDMKRLTQEYQTRDDVVTRPIIRTISQVGVEWVTAVAKTLANSTIALGLVRVTRKPNRIARLATGRVDCWSRSIVCGLARRSLMPREAGRRRPTTRAHHGGP